MLICIWITVYQTGIYVLFANRVELVISIIIKQEYKSPRTYTRVVTQEYRPFIVGIHSGSLNKREVCEDGIMIVVSATFMALVDCLTYLFCLWRDRLWLRVICQMKCVNKTAELWKCIHKLLCSCKHTALQGLSGSSGRFQRNLLLVFLRSLQFTLPVKPMVRIQKMLAHFPTEFFLLHAQQIHMFNEWYSCHTQRTSDV